MTQTSPNQYTSAYVPDAPDTTSILYAVSDLLTTYLQPLQINNDVALNQVVLGGIKDYVAMVPVIGLSLKQKTSKRKAMGGRMENEVFITIATFQDYTDELSAELYMARMSDLQDALFASHVRLEYRAPGIVKSGLTNTDGQSDVVNFGFNTQDYPIPLRGMEMTLHVIQQWINPQFQQD